MANLDTTRHLLRPTNRYVGARMQQGRSVLDSDWNEDAGLRAEELRQTFVELLGAHGSTNAGFSVEKIDTFVQRSTADGGEVTTYNFKLRPGSLWVGGLRLVIDSPETFLSQADWLQIDACATNLPRQPTAQDLLGPPKNGLLHIYEPGLVASQRLDLVYVEAWEQPVTAVEDSELRERALGGPDTSARIRRMRRIRVLQNLSSNTVNGALEQLGAVLTNGGLGSFDVDTCELTSAARLTIAPVTETGDQPCGPTPPEGYIGHEDQAIRVELRGARSLVWGFGNAAPLHRARIGAGRVITLLNRPRDPNRYPQAGQIAELIPWGSKLPNDEKVAELTGHLVRITGSYNPATGELELASNPPETLVAWLDDATDHYRRQDPDPSYIYVRIWDRGSDVTSDTIIEARGPVVPLGHTGLQLTLEAAGRSGDYWIIGARRATPGLVVPWQLLASEAPHGPRRFYAPLAILTWEAPLQFMSYAAALDEFEAGTYLAVPYSAVAAVYGPVVARVTDLRRPLSRLCMRGCATITVGDGETTSGMVDSLEDAVALLPSSGGRIQLLRGEHRLTESLILDNRSNITISGCGLECKIMADALAEPGEGIYTQGFPLITLKDCNGIVLEGFVVVGERALGIKLENVDDTNRNVRISGVQFFMDGVHNSHTGTYALAQGAILALGSDGLTVERCFAQYSSTLNYTPAMVLGGTNMIVRDNVIHAGEIDISDLAYSMGGLQILSYSQNVEITGNVIRGGWGYGIALGHMLDIMSSNMSEVTAIDAEISWAKVWGGRALGDALSNMHQYAPHPDEAPTSGDPENWTPGGPVTDIVIRDNRILGKGLSGISTGGFAHWGEPRPRFIVAINVDIHRNEIVGNLRIADLDPVPFSGGYLGVGGICLACAVNAQVRENVITDNGANSETPTVGVGFITAQGAIVQDNIIVDNGPAVEESDEPYPGLRGGIAALEITAIRPEANIPDRVPAILTMATPAFKWRRNSFALTIRNNEVRQRTGKALWVLFGYGPMVVSDNTLHGFGDPVTALSIENSYLRMTDGGGVGLNLPAQGACVEIRNYGTTPAVDYGDGEVQRVQFSDASNPLIVGGMIDFCRNEVSLNWQWFGGYAASVVLSSFDSVKVTDNVMRVMMGNDFTPGGAGAPDAEFFLELMGVDVDDYSFLIVNCWAGAASSVQASGNRFEEPRFDCVFSYLGAHAAAFGSEAPDDHLTALTNAAVMTMNIGSHCLVGPNPFAIISYPSPVHNVSIYPAVTECGVIATVDIFEGEQTVSIATP